jgi:hypothetical protein
MVRVTSGTAEWLRQLVSILEMIPTLAAAEGVA